MIAEVTAWFLMKMSFFLSREVVSQESGLVLTTVGRIMQYHSIRNQLSLVGVTGEGSTKEMDVTERKITGVTCKWNVRRWLYAGQTWDSVSVFQIGSFTGYKTSQARHLDCFIQTVDNTLAQVRNGCWTPPVSGFVSTGEKLAKLDSYSGSSCSEPTSQKHCNWKQGYIWWENTQDFVENTFFSSVE